MKANHEQQEQEQFDRAVARKESALKLLAPLGFVDSDDDEVPGAIWHKGCALTLDATRMSPAEAVEAILNIGRERGRSEIRVTVRTALGL